MAKQDLESTYKQLLDKHYLETLKKFVTLQNTSRLFKEKISQREAVQSVVDWIHTLELQDTIILEFKENNLPPALIVIAEPKRKEKTVMVYGYLDKQPAMQDQWSENKSAYEPVVEGNRIYGRGVSEGVGSLIASVLMIKAYQSEDVHRDRIVLFFETDKNSGSCDAFYFYQKHKDLIGKIDLLYCFDGTVPNYNTVYFVNSLKGEVVFDLKVSVGKTGVHSGLGGGLLPDSYRILSDLLNRIECPKTGRLSEEFYHEVPEKYKNCMEKFYEEVKVDYGIKYKDNVQPFKQDFEVFLGNFWNPQLVNLARENLPEVAEAGNVLRAYTKFRMKMMTCPVQDVNQVQLLLDQKLKGERALNNAKVDLEILVNQGGFLQQNLCPEIEKILREQTQKIFEKNCEFWSTGDCMPFVGQMKKYDENLQVILTGVKSFDSRSKSGNENLNLDYAMNVYQTMFGVMTSCNSL